MREITPCLWFDDKAEEAANFYVSIFSLVRGSASGGKNSRILSTARYGEEGAKASGRPKGTAMTVIFQLDGQNFMALNGGPVFTFSPAISFIVNCETQEEVDRSGKRCPKAERQTNAAGSRISMASHGKSFRLSWVR